MPIKSIEHAVAKHLTMSTRHLCIESLNYLELDQDNTLDYYKLDEYGWFLYMDTFDLKESIKKVPLPLARLIILTKEQGCNILVLDTEADILEDYPVYR